MTSATLPRIDIPKLALDAAAQDLLFREARSANTFTDEPVTDQTVQAIYDLVKWAPTAMNGQSLRVVLVRSEEARERLLSTVIAPNKPKTASAPLVAILAADLEFHERLPELFPQFPQAKYFFEDPAGREEHAVFNATLQAAYFILGVRAAGLAAGPIGGFDADAVNREFFGDGRHKAFLIVAIGKPGEDAYKPRNPRLEYDEVVSTV